jgi:xylulokinase
MGVMLSAAGSLRWFRDTFAATSDFEALLAPAADVPPGSEGLLFLPYLTGERTPYPDPLARGAFVGLTVRHRLPQMTRSVLEGVAFGLRDCFELMKAAGLGQIDQVRVAGGGAGASCGARSGRCCSPISDGQRRRGAAYGAACWRRSGRALPDVPSACRAGSASPGEPSQPVGLSL